MCAKPYQSSCSQRGGFQQRECGALEHLLLRGSLAKNVVEHKFEVPAAAAGAAGASGLLGAEQHPVLAQDGQDGGCSSLPGLGSLTRSTTATEPSWGEGLCAPTGTWGWGMGLLGNTAPVIWVLMRSWGSRFSWRMQWGREIPRLGEVSEPPSPGSVPPPPCANPAWCPFGHEPPSGSHSLSQNHGPP